VLLTTVYHFNVLFILIVPALSPRWFAMRKRSQLGFRLAGQLIEREPFSNDTGDGGAESLSISQFPIVKSERLLVQIAEQVKRLHRNVRAVDSALQERPEILQPVRGGPAGGVFSRVDLFGVAPCPSGSSRLRQTELCIRPEKRSGRARVDSPPPTSMIDAERAGAARSIRIGDVSRWGRNQLTDRVVSTRKRCPGAFVAPST
jgi:hypothetical protein